jgi:sigma-B regulation protein RsbU (phosphoserine phosphatase)
MHVEKLSVIVCNGPDNQGEGSIVESRNISTGDTSFGETPGGLLALLRETRKPQSLGLINEEGDSLELNDDDKKLIVSSGIVLSVPMLSENRLIGAINVGPKMSGKVYSQEDIDLLSTVAGQAAIAIENSRLHLSEIEKRRMEEEMSMARRIQQGLLPKSNPVIEGLDIAGISIPALSVGGDYYDFIKLGEKKILVVVADVSGKGMSAALYMSKIQGMIQLAAHMYASPKEMLIEVNRRIYDGIERKSFITMILALFDLEKREVSICRAGHNKALISWGGELQFEEGAGIGVGLEPGKIFEAHLHENRRTLEQGQLFLLYSDGLTEAMNEHDEEFGEDRVLTLVQAQRHASALKLQQAIVAKADEFRGTAEVHDDITVVVIKAT